MFHQNQPQSDSKTIWIGDIESWMDENYINSLFQATGAVSGSKIIRDRNTGLPSGSKKHYSGYGFVEFTSHECAEQVLQLYNGTPIPGLNKNFRLNWGSHCGTITRNNINNPNGFSNPPQHSSGYGNQISGGNPTATGIYVGELDTLVDEKMLFEFFAIIYNSAIGAKIIADPVTKASKGYGFVKFSNYEESQRAIAEMQGRPLRGRPIRTSQSFWKNQQDQLNPTSNSINDPSKALLDYYSLSVQQQLQPPNQVEPLWNNASASRESNGVKAKKDDFNLYALIPTLGTIDVGGLELGLVGAITSSKLLNASKSDETNGYTEGNGIGILNKDDEFICRNYLALANSKSIDAEISLFGLSY